MNTASRSPLRCIVPPHMLERMMESDNKKVRDAALDTLLADTRIRGIREATPAARFLLAPAAGRRSVYHAHNSHVLDKAELLRSEGQSSVDDDAANRLYDGLGATRDFFMEVFDRDSIDDRGHPLDGYVHVGTNYNNATFDGRVMRFGDGDGLRFTDFTKSLDVIAHELGHGVTQYTADLDYEKQPGALNESMSDVFGSLVKQWANQEEADDADWLVGAEVFTPGIGMDALRSMSNPGEAYDNPLFGKDPQPGHMDDYFRGSADNYGVHINSGIPNKAFYLTAVGLGGYAWEVAGQIWYAALLASHSRTQFQEFADDTYLMANEHGSATQTVVAESWREVGIRISGLPVGTRARSRMKRAESTVDGAALASLSSQMEELATQIRSLAKELKSQKNKK